MAMRCTPGRLIAGLLGLTLSGPALAEAVLDGSTGSSGSFAGDFEIPAAVGRLEGANLFHSFETFHIRDGESATFSGPGGIDNVISRVTGGTASEINGLLTSTVPGADFFFINPSGVTFGPNAALDVPAAFHVSTANELRFADGSAFSATDPNASSFTMAPPESFGFLDAQEGIVIDRASFGTGLGQTLSISGGSVLISAGDDGVASGGTAGQITTLDGPLRIAAVRSGSVDLATGDVDADALGPVMIGDEAALQVATAGSGALRITGGRVQIDGRADVLIGNLAAVDDDLGIGIQAEHLEIRGGAALRSLALGDGVGGPIQIAAGELKLKNASILSDAFATGDGGIIAIDAGQVAIVGGRGILSSTQPATTGDAGDIRIAASSLLVDSAVIDLTRLGEGAAGRLVIDAGEVTLRGAAFGIQAPNITSGPGGQVAVEADRLTVEGAAISTSTVGAGPGGDIVLDLGHLVVIDGGQISAATLGPGDAGAITIRADDVRVADLGTAITVFSAATDPSAGDAGAITIDAGRVRLVDGGAISSETSGGGDAGSVTITVAGDLQLRDRGQIRASSSGTGRPGDVTLDVTELVLLNGGSISSPSIAEVEGGDTASSTIRIVASEGIRIQGTPNRLSGVTTATLGPRDAGTIRIEAPSVQLVDSATLSSSTLGEGDAGAVRLVVGDLVLGPNTTIDSASPNFERPDLPGGGGEIRITASGSVSVTGDEGRDLLAAITTSTATRGDAGSITVQAPLVRLVDGGQISSGTQGTGNGGRVEVEAERIELTGPSRITTRSTGTGGAAGRAGGITLVARDALEIDDGAVVSAETSAAEAGDIVVSAGELVELRDGAITTSVAGGQGSGGNIFIDPEFVVLNNSRIVANAREGAGGNIRIIAENFFTTPDSLIDASSELGIDGTVDVTAPDLDLTSELAVLPTAYVDVSGLLRESCAARQSDQTSSFATTGGRRLAPDPAAPLSGRYGAGRPAVAPAVFHHWAVAGSGGCDG